MTTQADIDRLIERLQQPGAIEFLETFTEIIRVDALEHLTSYLSRIEGVARSSAKVLRDKEMRSVAPERVACGLVLVAEHIRATAAAIKKKSAAVEPFMPNVPPAGGAPS